jgi:metal-dependent amidase/aminoacylase/carboxypeptidase family protein
MKLNTSEGILLNQYKNRLGNLHFGEGNAHSGPLPVYASEDFGWFNHTIPGSYFFLSSGKE